MRHCGESHYFWLTSPKFSLILRISLLSLVSGNQSSINIQTITQVDVYNNRWVMKAISDPMTSSVFYIVVWGEVLSWTNSNVGLPLEVDSEGDTRGSLRLSTKLFQQEKGPFRHIPLAHSLPTFMNR